MKTTTIRTISLAVICLFVFLQDTGAQKNIIDFGMYRFVPPPNWQSEQTSQYIRFMPQNTDSVKKTALVVFAPVKSGRSLSEWFSEYLKKAFSGFTEKSHEAPAITKGDRNEDVLSQSFVLTQKGKDEYRYYTVAMAHDSVQVILYSSRSAGDYLKHILKLNNFLSKATLLRRNDDNTQTANTAIAVTDQHSSSSGNETNTSIASDLSSKIPAVIPGGTRIEGAYLGLISRSTFNPATSSYQNQLIRKWYVFTKDGYVVYYRPEGWKADLNDALAKNRNAGTYQIKNGHIIFHDNDGKAYDYNFEMITGNRLKINGVICNREDLDYSGLKLNGTFSSQTFSGGYNPNSNLPQTSVAGTHSITFNSNGKVSTSDQAFFSGSSQSIGTTGRTGQQQRSGSWTLAKNRMTIRWDDGGTDVYDFYTDVGVTENPGGIYLGDRFYYK